MVIGPYALGSFQLPLLDQPLFPPLESVLPVSPELYGLAVVASIVLLFLAGLETDLPTFLRHTIHGHIRRNNGSYSKRKKKTVHSRGSYYPIWRRTGRCLGDRPAGSRSRNL